MATNPDDNTNKKETIGDPNEEDEEANDESAQEQNEDAPGKENNDTASSKKATNINGGVVVPMISTRTIEGEEELVQSTPSHDPEDPEAQEEDGAIQSSALSWIVKNDDSGPAITAPPPPQDDGSSTPSFTSRNNNDESSSRPGQHICFPDSFTFHDDKSEGTRPDPPSTVDGRDDAAEISLNDMSVARSDDFYDPLLPRDVHSSSPESISNHDQDDIILTTPKQPEDEDAIHDSFAVDETRTSEDQSLLLQTSREGYGADNLALLPSVDEERFLNHSPRLPYQRAADDLMQGRQSLHSVHSTSYANGHANPERRKIQFRLCEEVIVKRSHKRTSSLLGTLRKNSTRMLRFGGKYEEESFLPLYKTVDRGTITVSWYNGTSSLELQQHVKRSVTRQIKVENPSAELDDFRILDESTDPPEEIVLSPFIPDGSSFLLVFSLFNDGELKRDGMETPLSQYSSRPPLSPSAAPSPHPSDRIANLNASHLALLSSFKPADKKNRTKTEENRQEPSSRRDSNGDHLDTTTGERTTTGSADENGVDAVGTIDARLEEIRELLLNGTSKAHRRGTSERRQEKRQVVFVVANYFVLFLALIALSAEMQARAPNWMKIMENHLKNVRNCSENQEALFECVSRGDFAGLIASVGLWLSRSVTTRRIFLFGFDTPKKLWTVVYESLVSSICWGISYVFIRRGMNPDTRHRFIQKYWKDAVYGSLAGFNATFLKSVLKNLIPQDAVEDAFKERQLKILGWLPSFA